MSDITPTPEDIAAAKLTDTDIAAAVDLYTFGYRAVMATATGLDVNSRLLEVFGQALAAARERGEAKWRADAQTLAKELVRASQKYNDGVSSWSEWLADRPDEIKAAYDRVMGGGQ